MIKDKELKRFLLGEEVNGRLLTEIWSYDDNKLESDHSFIQWIFPIEEISKHHFGAPHIRDISFYKKDKQEFEIIKKNILKSFELMLKYYGFEIAGLSNEQGKVSVNIVPHKNYDAQSKKWKTPHNHNYLRITRILKCLILFDLRIYAEGFNKALYLIDNSDRAISKRNYDYWFNAIA